MNREGIKKVAILLIFGNFLIPIQFYRIGTSIGYGVQWAFFRYQDTIIGNSLIWAYNDILYLINGTVQGKSAYSVLIWVISLVLMTIVSLALLHALITTKYSRIKILSTGICISAVLFLLSIMVQYGVLLNGPAGFSIPIGLPLLFYSGYWIGKHKFTDEKTEVSPSPNEH